MRWGRIFNLFVRVRILAEIISIWFAGGKSYHWLVLLLQMKRGQVIFQYLERDLDLESLPKTWNCWTIWTNVRVRSRPSSFFLVLLFWRRGRDDAQCDARKKNPDQSLVQPWTPLRHLALPFSFHTQHPDCLPWLLVYKCPPLLPDRPITLMAKSDPDSEVCRSNSSGLICLCQLFPAIYCYVLPDFLINCTTTVSPLSCSYASVFL